MNLAKNKFVNLGIIHTLGLPPKPAGRAQREAELKLNPRAGEANEQNLFKHCCSFYFTK
jgi:hypothetical protein